MSKCAEYMSKMSKMEHKHDDFDIYFAYACPPTNAVNITATVIIINTILVFFFNSIPPFIQFLIFGIF